MNIEQFGEMIFGPIVSGYTNWLHMNITTKYDKICFISRDGYIIKNVYEKNFGIENSSNSIYLYGSRQMFYLAAFTFEHDWVWDKLLDIADGQTIESCLERLSIINKPSWLCEECIKSNIFETNRWLLDAIFISNISSLNKKAIAKRKKIVDYWNSLDLLGKKVAFVDIGWYGSQQRSLDKILNVEGISNSWDYYFFHLLKPYHISWVHNPQKYRCFTDCLNLDDTELDLLYRAIPLFDSFFSAPHPMVLDLDLQDNKFYPVYDSKAYCSNWEHIKVMQDGCKKFCKKTVEPKGKEILFPLFEFLINYSKNDFDTFKNLRCSVSYGTEKYNVPIVDTLFRGIK